MSTIVKRGDKFQLKWATGSKKAGTYKQRAKTFDRKGDPQTWDAERRRRRQLGATLARELDQSDMTLEQFILGPWRAHAATLAVGTQEKYKWSFRYLAELLDEELAALDVARLREHQRLLLDRGVGANTIRDVIGGRLSGILQIAVESGLMQG